MQRQGFAQPTLAELREWWQKHDDRDVRRLTLEVQIYRLKLLETQESFDEGIPPDRDRALRDHRERSAADKAARAPK